MATRKKKTERNLKMEKWRFFPVLVKEEIVKNMRIQDIVHFAKCSKKCQDLLTVVPIHLPSALLDDRPHIGRLLKLSSEHVGSLAYFSILATSRKFYVDHLKFYITTDKNKNDVKDLIEKMTKARKSLKVKELRMEIEVDHAELITGILGIRDPSRIESIEIPKLYSQEVYDEIVKTTQWKNSKQVMLNGMLSNRKLTMPNVNFDDFLHFENVQLGVETLDTNDAVKFIQNFRKAPLHATFFIECRKRIQQKDLIRQEVEAEWVGDWHQHQRANTWFLIDPAKPDLFFYFEFFSTRFHAIQGGWRSLD
ncbi:unnamed protein product [Caenorhabditis brenneri]